METRKAPEEIVPGKATHDTPDTPQALIEFMRTDWADAPLRVSNLAHRERYAERRAELSRAFPGETLVVPAGIELTRANDTAFRFRPSSDFAYLAGAAAEPGSLLIFQPRGTGHETIMYVPAHNRGEKEYFIDRVHGELWVGRHRGVDESQLYFGVDRCRSLGEIPQALEALSAQQNVRVIRGNDPRVDSALNESPGDADFATHISEMRLIKDAVEIAELRRCCEVSKRAFEDVIRILPRAKSEREVEAAFWSRARIEANDVGYLTIAAAGEHACTLHWSHNHGQIVQSDLLLLDAGVEVESLYTADITRTLPIGGKFSAEQRAVYDLVYRAQQAAFAQVMPGNDFLEPNRAAMRVLAQGLIDLGILHESLEVALDPSNQFYRRYTLHNVSHMLGIDVHDCAKARNETYRYGALRAGMVLTVEPGLYFQPDGRAVPRDAPGIGCVNSQDHAHGCRLA
nr:Xaa-Pro aminopeptidase [Candidatus Eremiobacteraeota bacterium]